MFRSYFFQTCVAFFIILNLLLKLVTFYFILSDKIYAAKEFLIIKKINVELNSSSEHLEKLPRRTSNFTLFPSNITITPGESIKYIMYKVTLLVLTEDLNIAPKKIHFSKHLMCYHQVTFPPGSPVPRPRAHTASGAWPSLRGRCSIPVFWPAQ